MQVLQVADKGRNCRRVKDVSGRVIGVDDDVKLAIEGTFSMLSTHKSNRNPTQLDEEVVKQFPISESNLPV